MKATQRRGYMVILVILLWKIPVWGQEAFDISAYDIQMTVYDDNSYLLTETIDVNFKDQSHGIIRTLPLKSNRKNKVTISDVKVEGYPISVDKAGANLEIKIGDLERYAASQERYVISYRYTIGDDGLKDMDELYWNLIGLDWDCEIKQVSFTIQMPKAFSSEKLNFTVGKKGSTKNDEVVWKVDETTIYGQLLNSLGPNEALTVALPLPKDYFTSTQPIRGGVMRSFGWLFSVLAVSAGVAVWGLMGRKKQSFPTVEFYPPEGVNSADIGFLIDGRVDPFDITSLIIYWADKGYLTITEQALKKGFGKRKSFIFRRLVDSLPATQEYEGEMFQNLFYLGDGMQVSTDQLTNRFYTTADQVKRKIKASFEDNPETRIFASSNKWCRILLYIISVLGMVPCSYAIMGELGGSEGVKQIGQSGLMALVVMISISALLNTIKTWKSLPKKGRIQQLFFALLFSGVISGALLYTAISAGIFFVTLVGLISVGILGQLAASCNRRTDLGVWYEERLIGFREFLRATELDRIKMLVEENPNYFYNILPFAMVLGVTDKWARNFDKIMVQPPNWYHSSSMRDGFYANQFANELEDGMRGVAAVFASKPASSSSDSSTGGSAGGGSGGGGGRSW